VEVGRAACFYGPGRPFELREFPVPEPQPGAVVLRTTMATICGSDLHQWRGTFDIAAYGRPYPQVLGHELTGVVFRLGEGVSNDSAGAPIAVGDRVVFRYFYPCGRCPACARGLPRACVQPRTYLNTSCEEFPHFTGGYADYYYLQPRGTFFKVPDAVPDEMVAAANCALAQVVCALEEAVVSLGESVVIQGGGALGLYAAIVARERGAGKVFLIEGLPDRIELARASGVDEVLDLRALPEPEQRIERVLELTEGWGAEVVAEFVGRPDACAEGLRMLARGGRYLELGNIVPARTFELDPSWLTLGNRRVLGVSYTEPRHLREALALVQRTRLKYPWGRIVSHRVPLTDIDHAFELAHSGAGCRIAIVP
jgi:threonine dehydrogenase-like Zn-dependent dehydrogenase